MKFLVLGASGMAGHVISLYLKEHGQDVVGYCRRKVNFVDCICGDVSNLDLLSKTIKTGTFDIVINAVGVLNERAELEKEQAVFINSYLPHFLAKLTKATKTRIFQMSTDCVFKGNTGPYTELSFPDGESFYDRTKALGELIDDKNLTFRCSIVGPDINVNGIGLFNWFMLQSGPISGFTGAIWTGLTTIELARSMLYAANNPVSGLFNLVPSTSISKYDLLQLFNKYFKSGQVSITPSDKIKLDKTLVRTNYDLKLINRSYEEQIKEMWSWVESHKDIYINY